MRSIKNLMPGMPTNQDKLIHVAKKFGANIADQQGTTRVLYDTLPLDGNTSLKFFRNPSAAVNTLGPILGSNVDNNQGLLGPGEAMTVDYIFFQVLHMGTVAPTGAVTKFGTVKAVAANADLQEGFYAGNFSFLLANQVVLKPVSCSVFLPQFNSTITGGFDAEIFKLMTKASIMPNLQFEIDLNLPTYAAEDKYFIRCTIQGVGSILNLRATV